MRNLQTLNKQQGLATVLIVLLVGVSMTAMAMGLARSVKSTQHKQIAVHAATHAQSAAWSAVKIFGLYLDELGEEVANQLAVDQNVALSVGGVPQSLSAKIIDIDETGLLGDGIFVTVNIGAIDSAAMSSSTIQAVYQVPTSTCSVCAAYVPTGVAIFDDLSMTGAMEFTSPSDLDIVVNIDGSVGADRDVAFGGVDYINATGDVHLAGAEEVKKEVHANGDLHVSNGATVFKASVVGKTFINNGGQIHVLYSNDDVALNAGWESAINTRGDVIGTYVTHDSIIAGGSVTLSGVIDKIHARGDINFTGYASTEDIVSEGYIDCRNNWVNFVILKAEAGFNNCGMSGAGMTSGEDVTIDIMEEIEPITIPRPTIDVWPLKNVANYVFEYDSGRMKVTVRDVNGISDGEYFLGHYSSSGNAQFLCEAVDASNYCTAPATPGASICSTYGASDACFTYDTSNEQWSFHGLSMAPGIVWIDGNIEIAIRSFFFNTFVVAGDFIAPEPIHVYAANYVGFDTICRNIFPSPPDDMLKDFSPDPKFDGIYPKQLCDIANSQLIQTELSNVSFMVGGRDPEAAGAYVGGEIGIMDAASINGTVLAGGHLTTEGPITIRGYLVVTAESGRAGINSLGAATTIELDNVPSEFNPDEVPVYDAGSCSGSCSGSSDSTTLMWSRYL